MTLDTAELNSINFEAASQFGEQLTWKRKPLPEIAPVPLSDAPNPLDRIKDHGIAIESTPQDIVSEAQAMIDAFSQAKNAEQINEHEVRKEQSSRAAELTLRDLKVQEAIASPEDPIQKILKNIGKNLADAEKQLLTAEEIAQRGSSEEYNILLTKRDVINAFTYRGEKVLFVETGFIKMFNEYLRDAKGYGISEDHIAGVVGHEISHSDEKANARYISEEYCDVQGMKLMAYGGYNPNAMLDLTDFLIWLKGDKDRATIPFLDSHPNAKNRRVVIANELKNSDSVLPNQSAALKEITEEDLDNTNNESANWQEVQDNRQLVRSPAEVLNNIQNAENISQLLDSLAGNSILKRAELIQELSDNPAIDEATLVQAILTQLRLNNWNIKDNNYGTTYSQVLFKDPERNVNRYEQRNMIIGGIAKNVTERGTGVTEHVENTSQKIMPKIIDTAANFDVESPESIALTAPGWDLDENGIQLERYEKDLKLREIDTVQIRLRSQNTKVVQDTLEIISKLHGQIDLPKILSGDFSDHPELAEKLSTLGLKDFNGYLTDLTKDFAEQKFGHPNDKLASGRTLDLFPSPDQFNETPKTTEEIKKFLEDTKYYRATVFLERDQLDSSNEWDQTIITETKKAIERIGKSLSTVPQEQQLLTTIFEASIIDRQTVPGGISRQFCTSTIGQGYSSGYDSFQSIETFESPGLSDELKDLRITRSEGGKILEQLLGEYGTREALGTNDYFYIPDNLGREIDSIKTGFGQGRFIYADYHKAYIYDWTRDDLESRLAEIRRIKAIPPTAGDSPIQLPGSNDLNSLIDYNAPADQKFSALKRIAEETDYDKNNLKNILTLNGISTEEKVQYINDLLTNGKIKLNEFTFAVTGDTYAEKRIEENDKRKLLYQIAMKFLLSHPVSPLPFGTAREFDSLNRSLFDCKIVLEQMEIAEQAKKAELGIQPDEKLPPLTVINGQDIDLYKGMDTKQIAQAKLARMFQFMEEGGVMRVYPFDVKGLFDHGANSTGSNRNHADFYASILELSAIPDITAQNPSRNPVNRNAYTTKQTLIGELDIPVEQIRPQIERILELNKNRYTPAEKDKWLSMIGFCEQPNFLWSHSINRDEKMVIKNDDGKLELVDIRSNVDDFYKMMRAIEKLPESTYKDECLRFLVYDYNSATSLLSGIEHPGKAHLDHEIVPFIFKNLSKNGVKDQEQFNRDFSHSFTGSKRMFMPRSEKHLTDRPSGFYVQDSSSRSILNFLVQGQEISFPVRIPSPLAVDYRNNEQFKHKNDEEIERTILFDRLRVIQILPESPIKESMVLYSMQTALDNAAGIKDNELLKAELAALTEEYYPKFQTDTGKNRLFEIQVRLLTECFDKPLNTENIKQTFQSQEQYFDFVLTKLPEKSAFRDGFIILGVESYPLKVSDSLNYSKMLFAGDYDTNMDTNVGMERTGLELVRAVKQRQDITTKDISELVLWLSDEQRQIKSIDDLINKLSNDELGKQMFAKFIDDEYIVEKMVPGIRKLSRNAWGNPIATKIAEKLPRNLHHLLKLPTPAKSALVMNFLNKSSKTDQRGMFSLGFPTAIQKALKDSDYSTGTDGTPATYNSLLENFVEDNPTRKQLFFDLVLGEKGPLEESTTHDVDSFKKRFDEGFKDSEMHSFVDQIMNMAFRNAKFDDKSKKVASVAAHSFIEGLEPVRRATVIQNLLTELPKIDFNDSDPKKVQAKIFAVTLSSIGLVGAKIGQIDELVPAEFRQDLGSLKHGTKPMSKLLVADIFRQENLSAEYTIVENAGAASTACGYVIETPTGEKQFSKIIRPEVITEWRQDFEAVRYMIECLKITDLLQIETSPVLNQLQRLVERELSTKNEVNNVVQYISAETEEQRIQRQGLRAVNMPLERFTNAGPVNEQPQSSLIIFEELLNKDQFTELSKLEGVVEQKVLEPVYTKIVNDFLFRSLELGSWHTDLHGGNILVSKDGIIRREITDKDMVLIDFGQTGSVEEIENKHNAARFLTGLGLLDRDEVSAAIFHAIPDKTSITLQKIKSDLPKNPLHLQESVTTIMAQYEIEDYLTNFMKASINVIPYFRRIPLSKQYELISPYIPEDMRTKLRTRTAAFLSGTLAKVS